MDPFSGTFTTGFVAKSLERKTISIELSEDYLKIGLRRLGLATEYKGELLTKVEKTTKVKNRRGVKAIEPPSLFNLE